MLPNCRRESHERDDYLTDTPFRGSRKCLETELRSMLSCMPRSQLLSSAQTWNFYMIKTAIMSRGCYLKFATLSFRCGTRMRFYPSQTCGSYQAGYICIVSTSSVYRASCLHRGRYNATISENGLHLAQDSSNPPSPIQTARSSQKFVRLVVPDILVSVTTCKCLLLDPCRDWLESLQWLVVAISIRT